MKIALEPSTQWSNPVAGSPPASEALYAQDIAKRVKSLLNEAGHQCESFAGKEDANSDGARQAVAWRPDVCLSIHTDAGGGVALGTLCCYQEERSKTFGNVMLKVFCAEMGTANRGFMKRTPGVSGVAVIRIPEAAGIRTVLLELLRHDVAETAALLRDERWRQRAAHALANGLIQFCGNSGARITEKKAQPQEGEMILVNTGEKRYFPAGLGGLVYFDLTAQADSRVQLWFKRDNGDEPDQKNLPAWQKAIKGGTSLRFEAAEFFKVKDAINVMVDVLEGGPVLVTRTVK